MSPLTRLHSYDGTERQWQDLLSSCAVNTVFVTPRWQKVWWEQLGDGAEMLLLFLEDGNALRGIAPLARRNGTISFIGDQDVCDYNDFLVARGAESSFYPSLLDHLDEEEWATLEFPSLAENSPTLKYLPELATKRGYSVEVKVEDVTPGLSLPDNWDAYLQILSKKNRHELRRKLRRLHSAGHEIRYQKLHDPSQLDGNLEDFFSLMKYSRKEKQHFLTASREQFFRGIARELACVDALKLFFLELNGERVAAAMCFDYGDARLLYNSGYNPAYGYYSVGLLLNAFSLRDAIEEGKAYFDFLRGPEPYKYDLGGKDKTLYQMVVRRS